MVTLLALGCLEPLTLDTGSAGGGSGDLDAGGTGVCSDVANLELVPLDIWGRDLESGFLKLSRDPVRVPDPTAGPGVTLIRFGDSGTLQVVVKVDDHHDLSLDVTHHGNGQFSVEGPAEGRIASSSDSRVLSGMSCPVVSLYLGLDHAWFAATADAPTRNDATFLMDGEDYWAAVAEDLPATRERISLATWWWMSDFELVRDPDDHDLSSSARARQTVMSRMDALDGVHKRVLINRFWDENSDWAEYLNTDSELREKAEADGDGFEVVLQGNPTDVPITGQYQGEPADFDFAERVAANERYADRVLVSARADDDEWTVDAASYHQKFLVLDGEVAYITGMNVKSTDWDTHDHVVFEPGRMDFDASEDDREAVAAEEQLPDLGPRKDYGIRIRGPAARDAERVFHERWTMALDDGDLHSERATHFTLDEPVAEVEDGVMTQVQATLPEPWADMSIFESHAKAVQAATEYIFVEDQYFRAPMLLDVVVERMNQEPDLVLIVVTKDVSIYDGGAKYTYLADAQLRELFPTRYLLLQLKVSELVTDDDLIWDDVEVVVEDVDTHSKLRIVDDRYVSVGSCNWNNRGYLYEGELNGTVLDDDFGRQAREAVFENLVGPDWSGYLSDDAENNFDVLAAAAEQNEEIFAWWAENADDLDADEAEDEWRSYKPSGFVVPLQISGDYVFDVGPDAF